MIAEVQKILESYQFNKTRMMDILWDVHNKNGYISDDVVDEIARSLNMSPLDIKETASFYHFFHDKPAGQYQIYLADTVIGKMNGYYDAREALIEEVGCVFNNVSEDEKFGLFDTNCIGLSDQEPAMMIDKVVFTQLTPEDIKEIISEIREGKTPEEIANPNGHSRKDVAYIDGMVSTNIQRTGPVFFRKDRNYRALIMKMLGTYPGEVIEIVQNSNIRGRGGAGFPTGLKWKLCSEVETDEKYVICNADEGEPGTFKDRVILTRSPKDVFMGMIACAYSIGSKVGIIYLRAEYWYIKEYLEAQLEEMRHDGLLGEKILGQEFDFDIRIQMGAGAYVCGDETALIESCEGKRGAPRLKPPYPVQEGYLGKPTIINNVETFAAVSRIVTKGADWYKSFGTEKSTGTRLLSVSGDCDYPGIYRIEWGITLNEVLRMIGAKDTQAVQVSGPSGECVNPWQDGERIFCYSDLSCNGSLMIFNNSRDMLDVVKDYMEFFVDESCGTCSPCRSGNVDLLHKINLVVDGKATQKDLDEIVSWGNIIKSTSRCGLGMSSPNSLLNTLIKFPKIYKRKLAKVTDMVNPSFDMHAATSVHENLYKKLQEEAK
ncbi:MAG: NADP oxidoreductase [Sulfurovum sp.]|nr:MAG: NADP oxidoreductase [Sulfurovum sp.]